MAINRQAIISGAVRQRQVANSLFPPQVPCPRRAPRAIGTTSRQPKRRWLGPACRTALRHDPDPESSSDYAISTIIRRELKPLGITVKVQTLDQARRTPTQKYDAEPHALDDGHPDPDELATLRSCPSGAKSFFTSYNNPTVVKDTIAAGEEQRPVGAAVPLQRHPDRRGAGCVHGVPVLLPVCLRHRRTCISYTSRSATTTWRTSGSASSPPR